MVYVKNSENIIVHLHGSKYLAQNFFMHSCLFSQQTLILDSSSGSCQEIGLMNQLRVDHGMCRIGNYLYALGGRGSNSILFELDLCERLNIETMRWQDDMPDLQVEASCMAVVAAHNTQLYAFCCQNSQKGSDGVSGLFLQRLDTLKLGENKSANRELKWEYHLIDGDAKDVTYPVVVKLNKRKEHIERYLIACRNTYAIVWCEDTRDIRKSYLEALTDA